ncbi:MAG TPA: MFS transporter [Mycobacteriales bacterium]|nr:MFS transporter [Mycobacteriales bacterium]
MTQASYRQVLRRRRLAVFLAGDAVSKAGDGMVVVALPLQTQRIHGGIHLAVAIALIEAAPYLLPVTLSLVVGLGRRRFDPRRVLILDCVVRAVMFGGISILALTGNLTLWVLGGALFIGSGCRLMANAARRLIATDLATTGEQLAVNGLLGTSDSLAAYIAGPVLGGILAAAISPGFVLGVEAVSFLALLAVGLACAPGRVPPAEAPATGWSILRQVPFAARMFVVVFCFDAFYGPVEVALPLLIRGPLHSGGAALGRVWTAFGIGALIGALATNQLRRLPPMTVLVGIIAGWGASVVLLATASNVPTAALALAIGGLIWAPFTPVLYTLLQGELTPAQQQPIITLWSAGASVAMPCGLLLSGPLIQTAGARAGLVVSSLLTLALVPVAATALRR